MLSRRVLLATGAVVAGGAAAVSAAQITHRLDDAARFVGLSPKPLPDPRDDEIVRQTAVDQAVIAATALAIHEAHPDLSLAPIVEICDQQLAAVGGNTAATDLAALPRSRGAAVALLTRTFSDGAAMRAASAEEAFSPELVRVLASMSAGLAQCNRVVRSLT